MVSVSGGIATGSQELEEMQKIRRILTFAHGEKLEKELSKIASTKERKKAWVLIDGKAFPKDIAKVVGEITMQAIYDFLEELKNAGWIRNPKRKPPIRVVDYVPPDWIKIGKIRGERKR